MGPSWHHDYCDVGAYLAMVGVEREKPRLEFLELLIRPHSETFPFAHVDILLGSHPDVEAAIVQRQRVDRRLGGYRFDHARLFVAVAEDPGFIIRPQLGRLHVPKNSRTHLSVLVLTEEA